MDEALKEQRLKIIKTFNDSSKQGIGLIKKICEENNLDTPQEVAKFFLEEKRNLDLAKVADYLSSANISGEQNEETLKHFVAGLDFSGMSFLDSMRKYCKNFDMPGEAQKIDRMVEAFAKGFHEQNPGGDIANSDSAYLLAFQAMLLTTNLHNPNIPDKERMTLEQLTKTLKGTNDKGDFSPEFLKEYYEDIKKTPLGFKVVQAIPGFEINSKELTNDQTYKKLLSAIEKPEKIDLKNLFPESPDISKVTLDNPKPLLSYLTGYKGILTITSPEGTKATIQIYKPGILSSWFRGKNPSVIVQPVPESGKQPSDQNIKVAATIAASFGPSANVGSTYDYQKEEMVLAYSAAVLHNSKGKGPVNNFATQSTKLEKQNAQSIQVR